MARRKRPYPEMICLIRVSHGKRGTRIGAMLTLPTMQELLGQKPPKSVRALRRPPYPVTVSLRPDQNDAEQVACTLDRLAAAIREQPGIVTQRDTSELAETELRFPRLAE